MLLIAVIFLAAAVVNPGSTFFLLYPAVFAGMMPVTLISYDEKFRWNSYCRVLPYSAKQIVFSKYLLIILLTAALLVIYSLLAVALSASGSGINMELFTLLSVIFILSVAGPSLILPFIFRYGVEKGRIVFYIVIILLCRYRYRAARCSRLCKLGQRRQRPTGERKAHDRSDLSVWYPRYLGCRSRCTAAV